MIILTATDNTRWRRTADAIKEKLPCAAIRRFDARYFESLCAMMVEAPFAIVYDYKDIDQATLLEMRKRMGEKPFMLVSELASFETDIDTICHEATKQLGLCHHPMNKVWHDRIAAMDLRDRLQELRGIALKTLRIYLVDGEVSIFEDPADLWMQNRVVAYTENELVYMDGSSTRRRALPLERLSIDDLILLIASTEAHEKALESGKQRQAPGEERPRHIHKQPAPEPLPIAPDEGDEPF